MKTELLAPAGSLESVRAAVNAGADAIYMGGPLFSARAYAESSGEEMLGRAIEYCRLRGVRVYMTLNILMKEREMQTLEAYLKPYADAGLDAVIVQDPGVFLLVRECFPKLGLHVSTQATVTARRTAALWKAQGADRIVLPRELTLSEIREIKEASGAELEAFAHGALCYAYSGQCLMSSMIGGRSGNRGRCAGTCRLPYDILAENRELLAGGKGRYPLSMRDLETLGRLREMAEAGVYSFKLEGRMKAPVYVAAVTSVYRRYLDLLKEEQVPESKEAGKAGQARKADLKLLGEVFSRGGFTDGYLDGNKGRSMLTWEEKESFRVRDEDVIHKLEEQYLASDRKLPVKGYLRLRDGEAPVLTFTCRGISAEGIGSQPAGTARNRPLSREELTARIGRLGDTDFELTELETDMEGDLFIPVGSLNDLKRRTAYELKHKLLACDNRR